MVRQCLLTSGSEPLSLRLFMETIHHNRVKEKKAILTNIVSPKLDFLIKYKIKVAPELLCNH